jgi:hypothetical protein
LELVDFDEFESFGSTGVVEVPGLHGCEGSLLA